MRVYLQPSRGLDNREFPLLEKEFQGVRKKGAESFHCFEETHHFHGSYCSIPALIA